MAEPNWANRTLFHGDNLEFMRAMNSESVDLIATDPPFNKGKDFHATPDSLAKGASFQDRWSWEKDVHEDWIAQLEDNHRQQNIWEVIKSARHSWGDDMGAFLCFMAVRLIEMRRLLKPTGSIYLHCDPTASHYLKMLMDAIFGRKQFQAEITWQRTSSHNDRVFGNICDTILFYGLAPTDSPNNRLPLDPEYVRKHYRHEDARGVYRSHDLTGARTSAGESGQPWRGFDPASYGGRHWSLPKTGEYAQYIDERLAPGYLKVEGIHARLDFLNNHNLILWPRKTNSFPSIKRYLIPNQGRKPTNLFTDIPPLNKSDKERVGYPTQKPSTLYERFIKASSNEGDMVLDPFCGCATTCIAAEKLNRQWVGIDIWEKAPEVVVERLNREGMFAPKRTRRTPKNLEQYLFAEHFHFTSKLPTRTDDGKTDVSYLAVKVGSLLEGWQKIPKQKIVELLKQAQWHDGKNGIVCAGCGRVLELPFMHLDHIRPRSGGGPNDISNRVLLCAPCNIRKKDELAMPGLRKANIKEKWMEDKDLSEAAQIRAENCAVTVQRTYPNIPELTGSVKQ